MRKPAHIIFGISASAVLVGSLIAFPAAAQPAGAVPPASVCKDTKNPPKDAATQGGCVVLDRKKGNCMACHAIAGTTSGDIAPPLVQMKQRFPDKAKLRAQIWDSTKANPNSMMPPFGRHKVLTEDEIDKVVEYIYTL